ncbi:MAG: tRNA glutamyl-Q(34) synthetase GluQRS [Planctomycetota bacterium]
MPRTRLAPSPTGALHLGNARTFLVNWALARQLGWEVVLRIEDLDGPRVKVGASDAAIDTLRWLGMDWDEGPLYQLADPAPYTAALKRLAAAGQAYPCRCTRKEIEAASVSAPHAGEHELRYPGTCRPETPLPVEFRAEADEAWRLRVADEAVAFVDSLAGEQWENPQQTVGDFLVRTKAGLPSYQLAVVIDDHRQQIDRVVRGDDLLSSTHRQLLVQRALQTGPPPEYFHLPMVVGQDGRRLAKRHGDSRVAEYRRRGVPAERIVGLLAEWCGLGKRTAMNAADFLEAFDLDHLPEGQIVFGPEDDAWLLD